MIDHEEIALIGTSRKPGLLDQVRSRSLVVPEFQREFLWARKPDRTSRLLASIAQEWPAGALLLMEGDRGFQTHPVDGWKKDANLPVAKDASHAVLDGQQRLTALYQALFNRSPSHVFAVAILELLNSGEIDPEDGGTFRHFGKRTWERRYGSVEKQRDAGLIAVSDVVNPKAWDYWKDQFEQPTKSDLSELRQDGALAGLLRYQFPVSIVLTSAPDEALSNIFVTINQQGIKLTTFDLIVARTIKRKRGQQPGFNLRERWDFAAGREESEDAAAVPPKYERLRNFEIDPEVPLRLVRLIVDTSTKLSDTSILKLDPDDVRQRIDGAFAALERVVKFLEDQVGLIPQTLPDANYLLPMALVAHNKPAVFRTRRDSANVLRWYWSATFRTAFGRGQTGDLVTSESAKLVDWLIQRGPEPALTRGFWGAFDQELGRFVQGTAQNEHFMRAMFALEVAGGAVDWRGSPDGSGKFDKFVLADSGTWPVTRLDIHHMWARGVKAPPKSQRKVRGIELPHGSEAYEAVINRCLLLKETNIAIGNTPLPSVRRLKGVREDWIASNLIDPGTRQWAPFVRARLDRILAALEKRIPRT